MTYLYWLALVPITFFFGAKIDSLDEAGAVLIYGAIAVWGLANLLSR